MALGEIMYTGKRERFTYCGVGEGELAHRSLGEKLLDGLVYGVALRITHAREHALKGRVPVDEAGPSVRVVRPRCAGSKISL